MVVRLLVMTWLTYYLIMIIIIIIDIRFFDSKIIDGDLISNMREYIWFTEYTIYCIIWFHPNSNSLAIYKSRLKNRYFKT